MEFVRRNPQLVATVFGVVWTALMMLSLYLLQEMREGQREATEEVGKTNKALATFSAEQRAFNKHIEKELKRVDSQTSDRITATEAFRVHDGHDTRLRGLEQRVSKLEAKIE